MTVLISLVWYALVRLDVRGHRVVTIDGQIYLSAGRGLDVPRPFSRRWLLPTLLGDRILRWEVVSSLAMIMSGPLVALYVGGAPWQRISACCLFLGCPGIFRMNAACPVHVDPAGFALAMCAALASPTHHWLAMALAVVAGGCVERAPVFAAIFAHDPSLLVGLIAPTWFKRSAPATDPWLVDPLGYALRHHAREWLSWREMLLPWGMLAILFPLGAGLDLATLVAALGLLVGYGQMLIATDRARLYQWAAPAVIAVAVRGFPSPSVAFLIVLIHLFNPYRLYDI
ncbi:MAG: hypothetical protein ABI678_02305 [Kofleriaceae bacterium]